VSLPALDGALGELWSKLRITRVDYKASEGSVWMCSIAGLQTR